MPASEELTSIAVGGPIAGQVISGRYGFTTVIIPRPISFRAIRESRPDDFIMQMQYAQYREEHLRWDDQVYKLWVHDSIRDPKQIINELMNGYRPAHKQPFFESVS